MIRNRSLFTKCRAQYLIQSNVCKESNKPLKYFICHLYRLNISLLGHCFKCNLITLQHPKFIIKLQSKLSKFVWKQVSASQMWGTLCKSCLYREHYVTWILNRPLAIIITTACTSKWTPPRLRSLTVIGANVIFLSLIPLILITLLILNH